jgi:ATP-dependent RNA circularization protein (DNA/RNA ligase family)
LPRQASSTRKFSEVSREDILRASRDPEINSFKFINKYAEIEGAKYPVKGLLSLASDTSPSNFTTDAAARILGRLGFQVMEVQRQTSANHGKSFVHSEVSRILYHTKEEGILHMAITRIYSTVDQLVAETRMLYSAVDGVDTLTPEMACQIIRDAWKNNNRILMPFKNDAFRFYLERLLNDKLEQ